MTRVASTVTEATLGLLDGGFLQVYDGQTMLVQMRFDSPAFGPIVDGSSMARPLMVGTGRAEGVASQWVALTEDSVPVLAGVVGDDMLLSQKFIASGMEVRITSFVYRQEST